MGMGRRPPYTHEVTPLNTACASPAQNQEVTTEGLRLAAAGELTNQPGPFRRSNPGADPERVQHCGQRPAAALTAHPVALRDALRPLALQH